MQQQHSDTTRVFGATAIGFCVFMWNNAAKRRYGISRGLTCCEGSTACSDTEAAESKESECQSLQVMLYLLPRMRKKNTLKAYHIQVLQNFLESLLLQNTARCSWRVKAAALGSQGEFDSPWKSFGVRDTLMHYRTRACTKLLGRNTAEVRRIETPPQKKRPERNNNAIMCLAII